MFVVKHITVEYEQNVNWEFLNEHAMSLSEDQFLKL